MSEQKNFFLYIGEDGKADWGVPEGYPWKEIAVTSESINIAWDGNTEGKSELEGEYLYKVSDLILTNEQIKKATITLRGSDGSFEQELSIADMWDRVFAFNCITDEVCYFWYDVAYFAVVRKAGSTITLKGTSSPITFNEVGTFFLNYPDEFYTTTLTITDPVEQVTETTHPIAAEFLPEGVPYVEREYGTILEETILTDGVAQLSRSIPIIAGEKYTVHLDSGDVDSICKELDMGNGAMLLYLGNSKQMNGIDNGDTFVVSTLKTGGSMTLCIDKLKGTKISVSGPIMANLHNYELWTFTLEDGDTVIKKVAVSE